MDREKAVDVATKRFDVRQKARLMTLDGRDSHDTVVFIDAHGVDLGVSPIQLPINPAGKRKGTDTVHRVVNGWQHYHRPAQNPGPGHRTPVVSASPCSACCTRVVFPMRRRPVTRVRNQRFRLRMSRTPCSRAQNPKLIPIPVKLLPCGSLGCKCSQYRGLTSLRTGRSHQPYTRAGADLFEQSCSDLDHERIDVSLSG